MNWDFNIVRDIAATKFYNNFGIKSINISPALFLYSDETKNKNYGTNPLFGNATIIGFECDIKSGNTFDVDYVDTTYHVYLDEYYQEVRNRKLKQIGI